ncbi:hypothetical protein NQ315_006622 [Exocentrus adspersus]|uniref:Uncharacterized protein n=1 Tax=Exocentrus adspersus TaxID=1586481 RepID=A0AAV8VFC8_9CUCU|nr:hypothetical protein NQ315_006622 [Exocentrus adspersus]
MLPIWSPSPGSIPDTYPPPQMEFLQPKELEVLVPPSSSEVTLIIRTRSSAYACMSTFQVDRMASKSSPKKDHERDTFQVGTVEDCNA